MWNFILQQSKFKYYVRQIGIRPSKIEHTFTKQVLQKTNKIHNAIYKIRYSYLVLNNTKISLLKRFEGGFFLITEKAQNLPAQYQVVCYKISKKSFDMVHLDSNIK